MPADFHFREKYFAYLCEPEICTRTGACFQNFPKPIPHRYYSKLKPKNNVKREPAIETFYQPSY